jgi:DinB family protein
MLKDPAYTPARSEPKEETMSSEQEQWAAQLREVPKTFRIALLSDEHTSRHRPAAGEWSAIEVLGHMIDKMHIWTDRAERLLVEERPVLPGYDQDALVRDHDYQHADPNVLFEQLNQACERFATLVASIPTSALHREGLHEEMGPMTLRQCIETPLQSAQEHLKQLRAAQAAG